MAELCRRLSGYVDRDIIDKTGITGVYDVHLDLRPADVGDAEADPSSPFTPGDGGATAAAVKKLGLQMRNAKGTGEFIVIDHVERPSANSNGVRMPSERSRPSSLLRKQPEWGHLFPVCVKRKILRGRAFSECSGTKKWSSIPIGPALRKTWRPGSPETSDGRQIPA
jgi:hypothetical protein